MAKHKKKGDAPKQRDVDSTSKETAKAPLDEASLPAVDESEVDKLIAEVEDNAGVERSVLKNLPSIEEDEEPQGAEDASAADDEGAQEAEQTEEEAQEAALDSLVEEVPEDKPENATSIVVTPEELEQLNEAPKEKKPLSKLWLIPILLLGIVAGVYFGGVAYFTQNTLPNTMVNGRDVSLSSVDDLAGIFEFDLSKWSVNIQGDGLNFDMNAKDAGVTTDSKAYANYVVSSTNPWKWPAELNNSHKFDIVIKGTANREKIASYIAPFLDESNQQLEGLENGGIFYNQESGSYEVPDAVLRGRIDQAKVVEKIANESTELPSTIELGDECLVQDDGIVTALDNANELLAAAPITLQLAGTTIAEIDKNQLTQWLYFDENLQLQVNVEALDAWTHGPLCETGDTLNLERSFTRADGKEITVPSGTYGWMTDSSGVTQAILDHIHAGQPVTIDVPTLSEAAVFNPGGREWKRYIDVDITEQHVRYYDDDDNVVWEADCVTGIPMGRNYYGQPESYSTPKGAYYINNKELDKTMRGPWIPEINNWEYESPARIWLPFLYDSWAIHDAAWRYEYGGTIYQWNGSHGCVNVAYDNLVTLYDMVEVGTPVMVHD